MIVVDCVRSGIADRPRSYGGGDRVASYPQGAGFGVEGGGRAPQYAFVRLRSAAELAVGELCAGTGGVVTRAQVLDCGLSDSSLRERGARGTMAAPSPGCVCDLQRPSSSNRCAVGGGSGALAAPRCSATSRRPSWWASVRSRRAWFTSRCPWAIPQRRSPVSSFGGSPGRPSAGTPVDFATTNAHRGHRHRSHANGSHDRGRHLLAWPGRWLGPVHHAPSGCSRVCRNDRSSRGARILVAALGDVAIGCHSLLELTYLRAVERAHGLPQSTRRGSPSPRCRLRRRALRGLRDPGGTRRAGPLIRVTTAGATFAAGQRRCHRGRHGPAIRCGRRGHDPCQVAAQVATGATRQRLDRHGTPTCGRSCQFPT